MAATPGLEGAAEPETLRSTTATTTTAAAAAAEAAAAAPLPPPLPPSPTNATFPSKPVWRGARSFLARVFAALVASFLALVHRLRNIFTESRPPPRAASGSSAAEQSPSESGRQRHHNHHHGIAKSSENSLPHQHLRPETLDDDLYLLPLDDMAGPRGGGRKKENVALAKQKGKQHQQQQQQQQPQQQPQPKPQQQQQKPQQQQHQQKPQQQKPQQHQNQYQSQQQKPKQQQSSPQKTTYQQKPKQQKATPETNVKTITNGVKALQLENGEGSSGNSSSSNNNAGPVALSAAVKPSYSAALRSVSQPPQPLPPSVPAVSTASTGPASHAPITAPGTPDDPPVQLSPAEEAAKEAERVVHRGYMNDALEMARLALRTNETPVGCVLVYKGRIIAKGMNATNVTRNGTRHAELMALTALLSYSDTADTETPGDKVPAEQDWGDVDPSDGHIYPYGQKLHPSPRVDKDVIRECVLYVTVEPCVMCASLLRQLGIKKVYFGAVNDKFGGTGGVFRMHKNSNPVDDDTELPRQSRPQMLHSRPTRSQKASTAAAAAVVAAVAAAESGNDSGNMVDDKAPSTIAIAEGTVPEASEGDGGNVEPGYDVEGGWGRDDAVHLLRQFYVQENGRAPVPRKKEGRAARLAAMMEKDGQSGEGGPSLASATNGSSSTTPNTMPATPVEDIKEDVAPLAPPLVALPQVNAAAATAAAASTSAKGASSVATAASAASVPSSSDERKA